MAPTMITLGCVFSVVGIYAVTQSSSEPILAVFGLFGILLGVALGVLAHSALR
jgi:xanthosine utilization system XapX-like protein